MFSRISDKYLKMLNKVLESLPSEKLQDLFQEFMEVTIEKHFPHPEVLYWLDLLNFDTLAASFEDFLNPIKQK